MIAPRLRIGLAIAALGAAAAVAAPAASGEPDVNRRPLVMVVVIDGLDGDSVDGGAAPNISSLLAGEDASATYFPESRAVMPAVTNTNHMAMMSGSYAGSSGIPGNEFALYAPLANADTCETTGPTNTRVLPSLTSGENLTCPRAEMVFEAIKRQGNPDKLVSAAIFGKPKLGRIFAGRNVKPSSRDVDYLWAPCASGTDDDEYCGDVQTNPISGYAADDATVMDEVVRVLEQGVPVRGATKQPNLTFVNLHQVDSVGHFFGRGPAYDAAIGMADDEIGRLVATLQSLGEWERTVMVLLSDHSMETTPNKINMPGRFEAAGIGEDQFLAVNGDNGGAMHAYVADRESPDRFELLKAMRAAALGDPGVADALYRESNPADGGEAHTLETARPDWNLAGERSGDLFLTAKPGSLFANPGTTAQFAQGHHGSASTRDNFFAVIGGSALVRQQTVGGVVAPDFDDTGANPQQAENVDVAATVMGLFGMFAPADNAGRFLRQAFNRRVLREISLPERPILRIRDARKGVLILRFRPAGGNYDLQVRERGGWDTLARGTAKGRLRVREAGDGATFRLRSISAAGVKSRWRKVSTR